MGTKERIYARLPVWAQNLAVSVFGVRWYWRRFGGGFRDHLAGYIARERFDAASWRAYQTQELRRLLEIAVTSVPYYRRAYRGLGTRQIGRFELGDLPSLPLVEKDDIRARPEDFCVGGVPPDGAVICPTSGSTGTPVRVYITDDEFRRSLALREARSCRPAGVSFRLPRATFSGRLVVSADATRPPFHRFNRVERQVYFSAFHLSPRNAKYYVDALERHRTEWATGYTHAFEQLATMMLEQGLPRPSRLRAIITTSEKLTAQGRTTIERAFGCKVYEEYGTVEDALFAAEWPDGRLRLSPDAGIVELLDGERRPIDAGNEREGEVITTSFIRRAQPMIRYRLGDVARWETRPDPSGLAMPALREVVGRLEDTVEAPDGRRTVRFHGVFTEVRGVREAQVVQEARDRLRLKVVASPQYSDRTVEELRQRVHDRLGSAMQVVVERVDEIPRTAAGKFKAVINAMPSRPPADAHR